MLNLMTLKVRWTFFAVCLVLVAGLLAAAAWFAFGNQTGGQLADYIEITDGRLDPANEGQNVIVSGPIEMIKGAYDDEFGIQFDYPAVLKEEQEMVNRRGYENYGHKYGKDHIDTSPYEWDAKPNIRYYGQIKVGDIEISPEVLAASKLDYSKEPVPIPVELEGWVTAGENESDCYIFNTKDGRLLRWLDDNMKDGEDYTFVGRLEGNTLVANEMAMSREGLLNKAQLADGESSDGRFIAVILAGAAGIIALLYLLWLFMDMMSTRV